MNELISIQNQDINNKNIPTVNARDLHNFLESSQQFSTWIGSRIEQYDFSEGYDFYVILSKNQTKGRPSKEYYLTLDMAKELSMVERNARGKEARTYFIEMENKAKEAVKAPPPKPQDLSRKEILRIALEAEERADGLQKEKETLERVLFKAHDMTATALAGLFGISANELNRIMREENYLRKNKMPRIEFIRKGYFSVGFHKINHEDGDMSQKPYTKYTGKGAVLALNVLKQRGVLDKGFQLELNLAA